MVNVKEPEFINIEFECPICGIEHSVKLTKEDFNRYIELRNQGKLIQDIFPNMSKVDREKFLSGYCEDCQKLIFGGI